MSEEIIKDDKNIYLDNSIFKNLETYQDFQAAYEELDKGTSAFNWAKAELFYHIYTTLGMNEMRELSKEYAISPTTALTYLRAVKAFPLNKRNHSVSFSHHLEASYSDSYNRKENKFDGENRFEWIKRASLENLSSRELKNLITNQKNKESVSILLSCSKCDNLKIDNNKYLLYPILKNKKTEKIVLCDQCYTLVLNFIYNNDKKTE